MPRYRALERCFIDNCLRNEGDIFEYTGPRKRFLEPVDGGVASPEPVAVADEPQAQKPAKRKYTRRAGVVPSGDS